MPLEDQHGSSVQPRLSLSIAASIGTGSVTPDLSVESSSPTSGPSGPLTPETSPEPDQYLSCDVPGCGRNGRQFTKFGDLKRHKYSVHGHGPGLYHCSSCPKSLARADKLMEHCIQEQFTKGRGSLPANAFVREIEGRFAVKFFWQSKDVREPTQERNGISRFRPQQREHKKATAADSRVKGSKHRRQA